MSETAPRKGQTKKENSRRGAFATHTKMDSAMIVLYLLKRIPHKSAPASEGDSEALLPVALEGDGAGIGRGLSLTHAQLSQLSTLMRFNGFSCASFS